MKLLVLVLIASSIHAMDDVAKLHAAVEAVVSSSANLQLLEQVLKTNVNPNVSDCRGCYPTESIRQTMLWYEDNKMPIPAHLKVALQMLYNHGAFEVELTPKSDKQTDEKDADCIWSESDDEAMDYEVMYDEDI